MTTQGMGFPLYEKVSEKICIAVLFIITREITNIMVHTICRLTKSQNTV